jgi:hypothetical protein
MATGRFVVVGLAQARSPWFRALAQWSHSALVPIEFVKCASAVELRAHLGSGRPFSALLVDAALPALDRDLVDLARSAGCAVIVVDDLRVKRDWNVLGASAVIHPMFERKDLLDALAATASVISRGDDVPGAGDVARSTGTPASVAMVCGPGGTGASTVAIALAQGLADALPAGGVLLADFALHAELAMLHDAREVVPGIQELVGAHRAGRPSVGDLRQFVFSVEERRYDLLLGLRRARDWSTVRPRALAAAVESLGLGWQAIVCDTDGDLEGEDDGGSADVQERHLLARTAAARAHVAFVVGVPGMKGVHGLVRVVGELLDHDVPATAIVPVFNRAPRSPRVRATLTRAVAALLHGRSGAQAMTTPLFLPERRVDEALRDGVRLPSSISAPLAAAHRAVRARSGPRAESEPEPVAVGSLGRWSPEI